MFNIGDIVEVCLDLPHKYPITRIGSYGRVISTNTFDSLIEFEWVNSDDLTTTFNRVYSINNEHLCLKDTQGLSPVERKLRSIYARQYRKTGQSCFL